jgi:hypothetical protein
VVLWRNRGTTTHGYASTRIWNEFVTQSIALRAKAPPEDTERRG